MKKPNVVKDNILNLDHKMVAEKYEGNPKFLNYFCVRNQDFVSAVYKIREPDIEKKQSEYLLVSRIPFQNGYLISGIDQEEMDKYRYQTGLWCQQCNEIVYSAYRHHSVSCSCGNCWIDGGRDYCHQNIKNRKRFKPVMVDLLTDKFEVVEKAKEEPKEEPTVDRIEYERVEVGYGKSGQPLITFSEDFFNQYSVVKDSSREKLAICLSKIIHGNMVVVGWKKLVEIEEQAKY